MRYELVEVLKQKWVGDELHVFAKLKTPTGKIIYRHRTKGRTEPMMNCRTQNADEREHILCIHCAQ